MQPTCIRQEVTGTITQLELQFLAAIDQAGRSWVYRIKVHVILIRKAAAAFGNIHTAHLICIWDFIYLNVEIFCTSIWYFNSFCCWCTQMWNIFLWQHKYLLGNLSSVKQYNADVITRYETSKFIKAETAKERKGAHHSYIQVQHFTHKKIKSCKMRLLVVGYRW